MTLEKLAAKLRNNSRFSFLSIEGRYWEFKVPATGKTIGTNRTKFWEPKGLTKIFANIALGQLVFGLYLDLIPRGMTQISLGTTSSTPISVLKICVPS